MIMQKWACKTLAERVVLFHRRFGDVTISVKTLFNLYKKNGIKRKAFRFLKTMRYQQPEERKLVARGNHRSGEADHQLWKACNVLG